MTTKFDTKPKQFRVLNHRKWFRKMLMYGAGIFVIMYLSSLLFVFRALVGLEGNNNDFLLTNNNNNNNNNINDNIIIINNNNDKEIYKSQPHEQEHKQEQEISSERDKKKYHLQHNQADWILQHWDEHVYNLQLWLQKLQEDTTTAGAVTNLPKKPITAYLEPPLNATIPGTGNRTSSSGKGIPPTYYQPLPLRTQTPKDLRKVVYPKVQSCQDIPALLPIDRGLQIDSKTGETIAWNIGEDPLPSDYAEQELPYCPVDMDPFLPWIHDVFWLHSKVQFIAQNKRRCKTGEGYGEYLERMEPQVALLQPVSVQIIKNDATIPNNQQQKVQQLAPELWQKQKNILPTLDSSENSTATTTTATSFRYRLAPFDEADVNATRFICKFHTWSPTESRIELGETLSEYPFNYELADFRKATHYGGLLSRHGKDNTKFWTSTLMFSCPIPKGIQYNSMIQQQQQTTKRTKQHDTLTSSSSSLSMAMVPILYVDIIPIRTPPRYPMNDDNSDPGYYFHRDWVGPSNVGKFDPIKAWGTRHVLPEIEASGRWENIPACPVLTNIDVPPDGKDNNNNNNNSGNQNQAQRLSETTIKTTAKKPHLLSACLWAAASFRTRGKTTELTTDTKDRLKEWIDFHLLVVGFDHIYVYDNSAAHTNETNLSDITDLYDPKQVTRIDWPSIVCNNNIPAHDNTGERSSQYAAENSCRVRFGHLTEWIASIDTDEYLVPMGDHTSLRSVVENVKDTNILSFRSTRGKLRYTSSIPSDNNSIEKDPNVPFLEAYNCDGAEAPRPEYADRARKQLYRADYVLNHFVHYSTVTKPYMTLYSDYDNNNNDKKSKHHHVNNNNNNNNGVWERQIYDPTDRVVDELHEATMIHSKRVDSGQTRNYRQRCNINFKRKWLGCHVGFPWPNNHKVEGLNQTDGTQYNCFVNYKVENYWLPKLKDVMKKR